MSENRTRKAAASDMDLIYMMGFDTWAEGQSKGAYLESCRASLKYKQGTWYVLENSEGKPVSALITYNLDLVNEKPAIGIGSIATDPFYRRKGFAGQLTWDVMNLFFERDGSRVFYLHSDINPKFYENLGFVKLPEQFQKKVESTTMIRCSNELREKLLTDPKYCPPKYF